MVLFIVIVPAVYLVISTAVSGCAWCHLVDLRKATPLESTSHSSFESSRNLNLKFYVPPLLTFHSLS